MAITNYNDAYDTVPQVYGSRITPGRKARAVVKNEDIIPYPKAILVGKGGSITYIPVGNATGDTVSLTSVPDGWIPPHQVRAVVSGTCSEIYTIED
jgi:hypothetical protein